MQRAQRPAGRTDRAEDTPALRDHEDEVLTGRVSLDGSSFRNCRFKNATLVYSGLGGAQLSGCSFEGVEFEFAGPAANTLALLRAMSMPRSGLSGFVKASFPQLFGH